jgi:hypothetical protein
MKVLHRPNGAGCLSYIKECGGDARMNLFVAMVTIFENWENDSFTLGVYSSETKATEAFLKWKSETFCTGRIELDITEHKLDEHDKNSTSQVNQKEAPKDNGEIPKLTSKIDKDGNCVFNEKEVNEVLLWAIKK